MAAGPARMPLNNISESRVNYKLAFVNECKNFKHDFWYKDELKSLMVKHDMLAVYQTKIEPVSNNRWCPADVFACLEKT